jgi:pimeloyl-ACP methyl ester carboxylesterase
MMTKYQSIFKNSQAEAAYVANYDRALERWPVPYETKYVSTTFGDTHTIVSGPEDGEPLILLHGGGVDANSMAPVSAVAQSYRVYALDTIGFSGKSKAVKVIEDRATLAEWLTGVLDALNIEKAHMAGWSIGGFLTVNYALEKPERLKKIVLIAPAATFVPFSKDFDYGMTLGSVVAALATQEYDARLFASYVIPTVLGSGLEEGMIDEGLAELMSRYKPEPLKELDEQINSVIANIYYRKDYLYVSGNLDDEIIAQFVQDHIVRTKTLVFPLPYRLGPHALPEEDLKRLKTPTLLLIGDREIIYAADLNQVLKRAEELVENIQIAPVPNASHMLVYEQSELINSRIVNFLSGDA